jgi:hypothetical protein
MMYVDGTLGVESPDNQIPVRYYAQYAWNRATDTLYLYGMALVAMHFNQQIS